METRVLVLLALAASAIAGPIAMTESDKCAESCQSSNKYTYDPGYTYTYEHNVATETSVAGASEEKAILNIKTTAKVEVLSPCEFALRLQDTSMMHSDGMGRMTRAEGESRFRRAVEASELRFAFQNGVVDQVCSGRSEEPWVLNFKKGILSSFQNSMTDLKKAENLTESDVAGVCDTEYTVVDDGYYTTTVKKMKNMLSCTGRHGYKTMMVQMSPYKVSSDLQHLPIMKTTHECTMDIAKGGVLKSSVCEENHVYRPFSNGNSGGFTSVKSSLVYKATASGVQTMPAAILSKASLLYDHADSMESQVARARVEEKLKTICDTTRYDIRPESPSQFSELVSAMSLISEQDLEDLHKLLKTKTMCPENEKTYKFFLDALPLTSTDAAIKMMTSLIINDEIKDMLSQAWILSLGFVQNPSSEMLVSAKTLIDNDKTRNNALLPVSSMMNNFCKKQTSCDQNYGVLSIMASLERNIGYRCDASGDNFEKVLLSLRAIGNAGHATRAVGPISKCLTSDANPLEIKVAAAEAFRRMPCDAKSNGLWMVYLNQSLDSELRVNAYLSLMRCPSEETLNKIVSSLKMEEDDQVGAFVYSHLSNLKATSDPHKQGIALAVQNLDLNKEFDLSALKFSRNFEMSALINKLNLGFGAESNVVWASSTQMPRSVSGNFTIDLFGQAINLMDFGARMEGLDHLARSIWGSAEKQPKTEDVEGSIYGRVFGNELFFMHSKTMKIPYKMPSSWLDMLIGLAKKQKYSMTQSLQFMDVRLAIPTCSGLPLNVDVNGTAVMDLFLDGKMDLRKFGSSPRSLDIDGEVRPSAAVELTGSMGMDAAVAKTGLRMRNTLHTSTAIKGRLQLQRGQLLKIELDTPQEKMEIFNAKSNFYIVHNNVESEQAMIQENRQKFKVCSGDKLSIIAGVELCGELSYPNASMLEATPYFPFTGPSSGSVTLYKTDFHKGYKIFAKRVENKKFSIAQLSLNTPGSKTDRAILMEVDLNYPKQTLDATMRTPWKKAVANGVYINNKKMKSVSGSVTIDDADSYSFTSEVKIDRSKGKIKLIPMVEFIRPGADNVQLTGRVNVATPYKSAEIDLSLAGLQKMPLTLKASLGNTNKAKSITASFSPDGNSKYTLEASNDMSWSGKKSSNVAVKSLLKMNTPTKKIVSLEANGDYKADKSLKFDGSLQMHRLLKKPAILKIEAVKNLKKKGDRYELDVQLKTAGVSGKLDSNILMKSSGQITTKHILDYTIPKVAKNKITLEGKFNDKSTKKFKKYSLKSNLDIAKNPEYNLDLNVDLDHKKKLSAADIELKYGKDPKDKSKTLTLKTSILRKALTKQNADLTLKMTAAAPALDVNIKLTGKHEHNNKLIDSNLDLNYGGKGKDVSAGITLRNKSAKLMKYFARGEVAWPGSSYSLGSTLEQKNEKKYSHVMNLKSKSGMKHTMTTNYNNAKGKSHAFNSKINIQGLKPITLSGSTNLDPKNLVFNANLKYGKNVTLSGSSKILPKSVDVSGEFRSGADAYGFKTNGKMVMGKAKKSKGHSAKVEAELYYPSRKMTLLIDGGKFKGNKLNGRIEAAWDADKDKSQMIAIDGSAYMKKAKKSASYSGDISFKSPFVGYEDLMTSFKYGSDEGQHNINGKLSWGGKKKQISSTLSVQKPISLDSVKFNAKAKTPFKGYKAMSLDVNHSLSPNLKTTVSGTMEKMKGKMNIEAAAGKLKSIASLEKGAKKYGYELNLDHSQEGWEIKHTGKLTLNHPNTNLFSNWQHKSSDNDIKSALNANWGKKSLIVEVDGSHNLLNDGTLKGNIKIQSPWKFTKKVDISINHKHGEGLLVNKASLKQNGKEQALSSLKLNSFPSAFDLEVAFKSPYTKDFSGKVNSKYSDYPMTGEAQISWAPKAKATLQGSLNVPSWDDASIDLKLTTPYKGYRNVAIKAGNKDIDGEIVTNMNVDFGVRKSIDVENRFVFNNKKKMLRLKIDTPFDEMKKLVTGFLATGELTDFDGSADFLMTPIVGKFNGVLNWKYDGDLKGKLQLKTPLEDFPYFELSTSSVLQDRTRQSMLIAEYSPRQTYRLDTSMTTDLDLPMSFEATFNSPFPEYDNLGVNFQFNKLPSKINGHAELTYQPSKKIETDLNMQWSSKIEGSLVVKTPFEGYETSNIIFKHEGDIYEFTSHGEINAAEKTVSVDAHFKGGENTDGTFTFNSPIPGVEHVELVLVKKGQINSFRGSAQFVLNEDKFKANFQHELAGTSMKTGITVSSPYSEYLKFSITHKGKLDSFTNKLSFNYGNNYDVDTLASFSFDQKTGDVNGNGDIKAKLGEIKESARITFSKTGPLKATSVSGTVSYNEDDINLSGSWKLLNGFEATLQVLTPFKNFENSGFSLSHVGDLYNFKNYGSVTYMDNQNINGKIEMMSDGMKKIKLFADVQTPFEVMKSSHLNVEHTFDASAMAMSGYLDLQLPIEGYNNIGLSYNHSGNLESFNTYGDLTFSDVNKYSFKLNFYKYLMRILETSLEIKTPLQGYEFSKFEHRHEYSQGSFDCHTTLEYKDSKKINYVLRANTTPNPTMTLTLSTPFENYESMMAFVSVVNDLPVSAEVSSRINIGNGNEISLVGKLNLGKSKIVYLNIKSPLKDFTDVGINFELSGNLENFDSLGKVTYMDSKTISYTLSSKQFAGRINAEINTPFRGYELLSYDYSLYTTSKKHKSKCTLKLGNDKIYITTIEMDYGNKPKLYINFKSPIQNFEDNTISINVVLTGPKYSLDSNANIGGQSVDLKGNLDLNDDVSGSASLKTPIDGYKNLGMDFKYSGKPERFFVEGNMNYADGKDINGNVEFKNLQNKIFIANAELNTPFESMKKTNADVKIELRKRRNVFSSTLEYGNGKVIKGNAKLIFVPNYDLDVSLTTPFKQLSAARAKFSVDLTAPLYQASGLLKYNKVQAFNLNSKLNFMSAKQLGGNLVAKTIIPGFEYTKFEYDHKFDSTTLDGFISLTDADRRTMSVDLQTTFSPPVDVTLTIKTPYNQFSNSKATFTFDKSDMKYETSNSLQVNGINLYSMSSLLDYSMAPMRASTKISSEYSEFLNLELDLSHKGGLLNFESTGFLASPMTKNISAEASLNYQTPYDMSVGVALKSSLLQGMEDLKFRLDNSDMPGEKKMAVLAGWTERKQIQSDVAFRSQDTFYETSLGADVSLSTPFEAVQSLSLQVEGSKKKDGLGLDNKIVLELNDAKLLDVNGAYSTKANDKHEATLNFNLPQPMEYTVSGSIQDGSLDADVYANWNKDDANSNARMLGNMKRMSDAGVLDQSVDVSIEGFRRKMGMSHTLVRSAPKLSSTGTIYWDSGDEDKISYDLSMSDSSRRNKKMSDASLKLGLPSRTLELAGSLSDSPLAKAADATFSWDIERDTDKKVGLKATVSNIDNVSRGDVTLSMPALQKEIRVDGELMFREGRIILDSKTDISYSNDARKTLTLVSKVKDITGPYSNYNYSMEFGLSHPYTNIDLQMNSHLGSSDESMTMGLETRYLTNQRQTKNLALLTEINKLKQQINVQMFSPLNNFELVGKIEPEKLTLLNTIGGEEVMRSEMTYDLGVPSAEINTVIGDEKFILSAEFPNEKEFRGVLTYATPEENRKEALLAVRLNTSRLLHSRLAWRPNFISAMGQALKERAARGGVRATQAFARINRDIADEVTIKYNVIASHIVEEVQPFVDTLDRKLVGYINYGMSILATKMQENQMSEKILQEFNSLHMAYHRASSVLVTSLRNALNDIIEYPIRARYSTLSEDAIIKFGEVLYSSISTMEQLSSDLRQTIQNFENNRKEFLNIVSNSVYDATYGKVKNIDISPYTNYMSSLEIPEELTNAIDTVKSTSVSTIKSLWQRPEVDVVRGGLNSVYQQGAWAYKYWDIENNMQKNMEHMMDLLVEIIQDELKELAEATKSIQSPITVWDPEQGEIQAQIKLPFDWEKLYESPDLGPLTTAVDKAVERVEKIYKIVFPNDAKEEEEELQQEEMEKEIEAFKPMSNKLRRIDTVNRSSMRRMGTRTMGTRTMGTRTSGSKYSFSRTRTSGSRYSGSRSSGSRSSGSRSSFSSSFSRQVPTRTRTVSRRRITRS